MNKDFKLTLNHKTYPYLIIEFENMDEEISRTDKSNIKIHLKITLANHTNHIVCDFRKQNIQGNHWLLTGNYNFKFSDFKLTPPISMGGLIKVKQDLTVEFSLAMMRLHEE